MTVTRCHGVDSSQPAYLGDRDYFRAAVTRRSFVAGDYILGRLSGKPSITFALPVLGADGQVLRVVYVAVDLTEMAKSVAAIQLPPGAAVGIHDRNGVLLASKPALPIKVGQKVASVVLREAVQAKSTGVREGKDASGELRLWAFMPSGASADSAFSSQSASTVTSWWGLASVSWGLSWPCSRWWHFSAPGLPG
ncbi:hypothetical protein LP415_24925 [Polaromonas sp. P1(28)-8]|nr:hypothetical protein LP415_24925 [Polaromonas sp. P1(28)-8]